MARRAGDKWDGALLAAVCIFAAGVWASAAWANVALGVLPALR